MIPRQHLVSIMKGLTSGTVVWCLLATLRVLSGKMADTPGLLLIVVLGLAATLAGRRRLLLAGIAILAGTVLLVSFSPFTPMIGTRWERQSAIPKAGVDAVVVLSGGLNPDTTVTSDAVDRLLTGVEIVNRGSSTILVTTTTEEVYPTGLLSSEVDQSRLLNSLAPRVVWLHAPGGRSTRDEATSVSKLLRPIGLHRIAVVTSPMHTRRACRVFEAVGFVVFCTPARMRDESGLPPADTPATRLALFGQLIYEVAAMADYSLRGWLSPSPQARSTVTEAKYKNAKLMMLTRASSTW